MFGYSSDSVIGRNFRRPGATRGPVPVRPGRVTKSESGPSGRVSEFAGMRCDGSEFAMELEGTQISVEGRPNISTSSGM